MNQLYQQLNQNKVSLPLNPQVAINKLLQNNPKLKPYMDMIRGGANPKQMFYNLAREKGVDPESFLAQFR